MITCPNVLNTELKISSVVRGSPVSTPQPQIPQRSWQKTSWCRNDGCVGSVFTGEMVLPGRSRWREAIYDWLPMCCLGIVLIKYLTRIDDGCGGGWVQCPFCRILCNIRYVHSTYVSVPTRHDVCESCYYVIVQCANMCALTRNRGWSPATANRQRSWCGGHGKGRSSGGSKDRRVMRPGHWGPGQGPQVGVQLGVATTRKGISVGLMWYSFCKRS